jgi:hypothetical protein
MFLGQLKNLHKSCLVAFKKEMLDGMRGVEYNFADVVSKARERCEENFSTAAKEALVEGTDWSWEDELELLKEEVGSVADQCRKDETKKLINLIEVRCGCGYFWKLAELSTCSCLFDSGTSRNISRNLLLYSSIRLRRICGMVSSKRSKRC